MKHTQTILTVFALSLLVCSCTLDFDVSPKDINITSRFTTSGTCPEDLHYQIECKDPYPTSFSGNLGKGDIVQHWVGVTWGAGRIPMDIKLVDTGRILNIPFSMELLKDSVSDKLVFTAVCDDPEYRPVVLLDKIPFAGVFTPKGDCGWIETVDLLAYHIPGLEGDMPLGSFSQPFLPVDLKYRPVVYSNALGTDVFDVKVRTTHVASINKAPQTFTFPHPVDLAMGQRFDFTVTCSVSPKFEATIELTPIPADGDRDEQETPTDGDGEENDLAPDGDVDLDNPTDGDASPGDLDTTNPEKEIEPEPELEPEPEPEPEKEKEEPCGLVKPSQPPAMEAETIFVQNPLSLENPKLIESEENTVSGGKYVQLDAGGDIKEMTFQFDVEADWSYFFNMKYLYGNQDSATVQIFLDDAVEPILRSGGGSLTADTDLYRPCGAGKLCSLLADYMPVCLRQGQHVLHVKVVGGTGEGRLAGVDRIGISPD